jgi:hypothetical protein
VSGVSGISDISGVMRRPEATGGANRASRRTAARVEAGRIL